MRGKVSIGQIIALLLLLMPLPLNDYYDELLCLLSLVYILKLVARKELLPHEVKIGLGKIVLAVIGIVSNIASKLYVPTFYIAVDILFISKMFIVFIAFSHFFSRRNRKNDVARTLSLVAKIVIIFCFLTALITQFVDIGMTIEQSRYGLSPYGFVWKNGIQTAWLLSACLSIILYRERREKSKRAYTIMVCATCILTTKATAWLIPFFYLLLVFFFRNKRKLNIRQIVLSFIAILPFLGYQINTYLLNTSSIRSRLLYYGWITAKTYFPLGSGFATYGSELAVRNYSDLYTKYGFNSMWGMTKDNPLFLNDNYFAMILGQLGIVGLFVFIGLLYQMFRSLAKSTIEIKQKYWALATFLTMCVSMIGSATSKSKLGVFATIFIAFAYASDVSLQYKRGINDD